jgi:hypothetical protein
VFSDSIEPASAIRIIANSETIFAFPRILTQDSARLLFP